MQLFSILHVDVCTHLLGVQPHRCSLALVQKQLSVDNAEPSCCHSKSEQVSICRERTHKLLSSDQESGTYIRGRSMMPSLHVACRINMRHPSARPGPAREEKPGARISPASYMAVPSLCYQGVHSSVWNGSLPSSSETVSPPSGVKLHSTVSNCKTRS